MSMLKNLFCANQELNETAISNLLQKQSACYYPEESLGKLEEIALRLGAQQGTVTPQVNKPWISVFASDHGVAQQEVSEHEPDYMQQTLQAFNQKATAINILAEFSSAQLELVDVGVLADLTATLEQSNTIIQAKVALATQDFTTRPAMTEIELIQALEAGISAAERAKAQGADLFIGGEIAQANTTSALAMISVLSGKTPEELLQLQNGRPRRSELRRAELITNALELHKDQLTSPLKILQYLGGFETAALCAAYIRSVQQGMPIVVDGLMSTTALWIADMISRNDQLVACKSTEQFMEMGKYSVPETMFCLCGTCPRLVDWCFFSHQSAITAYGLVLDILAAEPLVKFDMKLGEGSGAALVIPLLRQACQLQNQAANRL